MIASLKNLGEKTANLFERKKKDAEELAAEKIHEAQQSVEEQAKKTGELIAEKKNEAEKIIGSKRKFEHFCFYFVFYSLVNRLNVF